MLLPPRRLTPMSAIALTMYGASVRFVNRLFQVRHGAGSRHVLGRRSARPAVRRQRRILARLPITGQGATHLMALSTPPLSRRRFLQTVAATAAVAPWARLAPAPRSRCCVTRASARQARRSPTSCRSRDIRVSSSSPWPMSIWAASTPLQQRFPEVRVYQDWRELLDRERKQHRLGERLDPRPHALPRRHGGAPSAARPCTSRSRSATRCTRHAALTEYARRRGLTTQMGIQVSSSPAQLYGEALVRSGVVGKIKEVHTFSNKSWGDDKPVVPKGEPVPAPFAWDEWLGVSAARPFVKGGLSPGRVAAARRVRHGHARRHGLPHLQSALSRLEALVAGVGDLAWARADRARTGRRARGCS